MRGLEILLGMALVGSASSCGGASAPSPDEGSQLGGAGAGGAAQGGNGGLVGVAGQGGGAGQAAAGKGGQHNPTNCAGLPSSWTARSCYPRDAVPLRPQAPAIGGAGGGGGGAGEPSEAGAAGSGEPQCPPASEVALMSSFGPVLGPEIEGEQCCYTTTHICG